MKLFKRRKKKKLKGLDINDYKKIEVNSGEYTQAGDCLRTAFHFASKDNFKNNIAIVLYKTKSWDAIYVHLINKDDEGNYIDNCVGELSKMYEYYLLQEVEYKHNINFYFDKLSQMLYDYKRFNRE